MGSEGLRHAGDGTLACTDEEREAVRAQGYAERDTVVTKRLDDCLAGAQIDVVKMDVEGFEFDVVAGAGTLLAAAAYDMGTCADICRDFACFDAATVAVRLCH